ncbi:hypothetical protein [Arabiibacter massiliensis]|uniref:hypothetical protein n=1 Tax=Arabiibacter massiliensis TaxID=1870985 RepID=UPI0009BBB9AD|nr:hypothetical protein [Arabiibacter massiliensis]
MAESEREPRPRYRVRPVTKPVAPAGPAAPVPEDDPFLRPEAEDDDGYDPFSDRPPAPEPTFQEDPWR